MRNQSKFVFLFNSIIVVSIVLTNCSKAKTENTSSKFEQYYVQGEQLYVQHCSNCHQKNGKGLGLIYPPLDSSDYMDQHLDEVICLIKYGKSEELIINGKSFIQPMPGVSSLTDLEIAEVATYIYNTWSHKKGIIEVKDATKILSSCTQKE